MPIQHKTFTLNWSFSMLLPLTFPQIYLTLPQNHSKTLPLRVSECCLSHQSQAAMADKSRLYEIIPPHTGRSPKRAKTLNHPPGYGRSAGVKPPSPPPPRTIPPVPPRNKASGDDYNSLPNSFTGSPNDRWNGTGTLNNRQRSISTSHGEFSRPSDL